MAIPMSEQTPLVKAVGLHKTFGGVDVLKNANLELLPGEIHGLVGENGAGKSTLAKLIGGLHACSVRRDRGQRAKRFTFTVRATPLRRGSR